MNPKVVTQLIVIMFIATIFTPLIAMNISAETEVEDGWADSTFGASDLGNMVQFVQDSNGNNHVTYWNGDSDMMYGTDATGSWVIEEVIDGGVTESKGYLTVDSNGNPAIICASSNATPYMTGYLVVKNGESWDSFEFDDYATNQNNVGQSFGISYDSYGDLYIYFTAGRAGQTQYIYEYYGSIGNGFTKTTVTSGSVAYEALQLLVSQDLPNLTYNVNGDAYLATFDVSWEFTQLLDGDAGSGNGYQNTMAIYDSALYFAYYNSTADAYWAMIPNGVSWDYFEIWAADENNFTTEHSITVDSNGLVYVGYGIESSSPDNFIMVAKYDGDEWVHETIASDLDGGVVGMATNETDVVFVCVEPWAEPYVGHLFYQFTGPSFAWIDNDPLTEVEFNESYYYHFTVDELGAEFSLDTDASFLSINATGVLTGVCDVAGEYYVNVNATIDGESIYHNYTLTVNEYSDWVQTIYHWLPNNNGIFKVAPDGSIHVIYTYEDEMVWTNNVGGVWSNTTLLETESSMYTYYDFMIDADGNLLLLYLCDDVDYDVRIYTYADGVGTNKTVFYTTYDAHWGIRDATFTMDADGNIHGAVGARIAMDTGDQIYYFYEDGESYSNESVTAMLLTEIKRISIAITDDGYAYIMTSVNDGTGFNILISENTEVTWDSDSIYTNLNDEPSCDCYIFADSDGNAHAIWGYYAGNVTYANSSTDWVASELVSATLNSYCAGVDSYGRLFIAWASYSGQTTTISYLTSIDGDVTDDGNIITVLSGTDYDFYPKAIGISELKPIIFGHDYDNNDEIMKFVKQIAYDAPLEEADPLAWVDNSPDAEADWNDAYSYNFNTNDEANTTYDITTDASFLVIDDETGIVSGTVDEAGEFYVNVTATKGEEEIYHNYTLTANALVLAWINHSPAGTADEGASYTYTFTTNYVGETYAVESDASWLTINPTTGVLSGTTDDGTFYVNVTATVGEDTIYHNYTLTVANDIIEWANHSPATTASEGASYTYTFTTNKVGEVFAVDTDANWLTINATTGVLSGITDDGTFYVNVTATFDGDTIYHNYTLTVANSIVAWIAHSPASTASEGASYTYTFTTNKVGEVFAVETNANWLTINSSTGVLSGTANDGTFYVNVTATFDGDTIYHNYTLTVANSIVAWLAHSPASTDTNNTTYTYTFTTNKVGEVFAINSNASWLAINSTTGVVSGIAEAGIYYVNVTATFDGDTIYHNYTLTVTEPAEPAPPEQPTANVDVMNAVAVLIFLMMAVFCIIAILYSVLGRVDGKR